MISGREEAKDNRFIEKTEYNFIVLLHWKPGPWVIFGGGTFLNINCLLNASQSILNFYS